MNNGLGQLVLSFWGFGAIGTLAFFWVMLLIAKYVEKEEVEHMGPIMAFCVPLAAIWPISMAMYFRYIANREKEEKEKEAKNED